MLRYSMINNTISKLCLRRKNKIWRLFVRKKFENVQKCPVFNVFHLKMAPTFYFKMNTNIVTNILTAKKVVK